MSNRIRIAIQKKGRLHQDCMKLFKKADFSISSSNTYLLKVTNFPLDIILVRDDDVPYVVASEACHWGIVGNDVYEEIILDDPTVSEATHIENDMDFGQCRLSIAVPERIPYNSIKDLANKKIATSYPEILRKYLASKNITSTIVPMHGSVEVAPKIDIADAICDLVSSGATLQENRLLEKETIFNSHAILIRNNKTISQEEATIYKEFLTRIESVRVASKKRYVMMNIPKLRLKEALQILPNKSAPTILQLTNKDMLAIHVLLEEKNMWDILHQLEASEASSILVLPVEKMIL